MDYKLLVFTPPALRDTAILSLKTKLMNYATPELQKVARADLTRKNVSAWLENALNLLYPNANFTPLIRQQVVEAAAADLVGYGPIELLLADSQINEIMINGPKLVFIEKNGELYQTDIMFEDNAHLMRIIDRI